jgi:hypothetical protein
VHTSDTTRRRLPRRCALDADHAEIPETTRDVPPARPWLRWLTIALWVMVGVTATAGIYGVVNWLTYTLAHLDTRPSLADVREHQETTGLFWPALLVTALLWLARSQIVRRHLLIRLLALAITVIALYGLVVSTITGEEPDRDPLVVRTWECPAGISPVELRSNDPRCRELPIADMVWLIIEEDTVADVASPTLRMPSSQEGNTATWDGLPRGIYALNLATEADLSSFSSVSVIAVRNGEAWGVPQALVTGQPPGTPYWTTRVEISPPLEGFDIYVVPGSSVFALGR